MEGSIYLKYVVLISKKTRLVNPLVIHMNNQYIKNVLFSKKIINVFLFLNVYFAFSNVLFPISNDFRYCLRKYTLSKLLSNNISASSSDVSLFSLHDFTCSRMLYS